MPDFEFLATGRSPRERAQDLISWTKHSESTTLVLRGLGLTALPDEVCELHGLRVLDLSQNDLGTLPSDIGKLTDLVRLNLSRNQIASLPSDISRLTALRWLSISQNGLSKLQDEIFRLTSLETLDLGDNKFRAIPADIGNLIRLQYLDLQHNNLVSLPSEVKRLSALTHLDLSYNSLEELLPVITELTGLQNLFIDGNRLQCIPDLIGRLTKLRILSVQRNELTFVSPHIGRLAALRRLRLSRNYLTALPEEVALLRSLEQLEVSFNRLTALPKDIGQIRSLEKQGLLFEGNPLPYPPVLFWPGQPGTTHNVLAWLRGELDDEYPATDGRPDLDNPPALPRQTVRPFVEITNNGNIDFVPPEALDAEGNNVPQLRRLHPALRAIANELCSSLPKGNSQHPALERRCTYYRELVDRPLDEVDFGKLYLEGIRLEHARQRDDREVADNTLPQLPAEADEALKSLLRAHASFILATAAGVEGIAAEAVYEATPHERRIARTEEKSLARSLTEVPNISAEVREALQHTVEDTPGKEQVERVNVAEIALLRNVTAAVITSAAIASAPLVAFLIFGPDGTIVGGAAALPIFEGLKATKVFARARGYISSQIDRITEGDAQQLLLRVREGRAAVQRLERAFWRVAGRQGFEWLGTWLEWLLGHQSGDKKEDG